MQVLLFRLNLHRRLDSLDTTGNDFSSPAERLELPVRQANLVFQVEASYADDSLVSHERKSDPCPVPGRWLRAQERIEGVVPHDGDRHRSRASAVASRHREQHLSAAVAQDLFGQALLRQEIDVLTYHSQ